MYVVERRGGGRERRERGGKRETEGDIDLPRSHFACGISHDSVMTETCLCRQLDLVQKLDLVKESDT